MFRPSSLLALSLSFAGALHAASYSVTDLGGRTFGTEPEAFGINVHGQVVGRAFSEVGNTRPVVFLGSNGTEIFDLGIVGPPIDAEGDPADQETLSGRATAINVNGQATGWGRIASAYEDHAGLFTGTGTGNVDLGTLEGGHESRGRAINASGTVVGSSTDALDRTRATRFSGTGSGNVDLGTLGGTHSYAYGINDSGVIVGAGNTASGDYKAIRYSGTGTGNFDLGALEGGTYSEASAINASGQIVGFASRPGGYTRRAVLFSGTGTDNIELGSIGGVENEALAINAAGTIVGRADDANGQDHAFVYTAAAGMQDLNTLIPAADAAKWELEGAVAINDAGQIVVRAKIRPGYNYVALRLDPIAVPPASPAMPPPAPQVSGKPKVSGSKAALQGTLTPGTAVEYSVKGPTFKRAKAAGSKWKITVGLKPGKNVVTLRTVDLATGQTSATKKIVIKKKQAAG